MRLFTYFKNLFRREKPEPVNEEDEFVYKQFRQITSALSKKLVPMQNIEYNKIGFVSPERRYEAPTVGTLGMCIV